MKCSTCGKEIPETSQVCPFCFTTIEHTSTPSVTTVNINDTGALTTINTTEFHSDNNELNFGDLNNNTSFDEDHNTLKTYFNEPKKRRKLLMPIIGVLIGFVVLFIVLAGIKGPTVESYKYYTGIVDKVYNYVNDNFTSRDAKNVGTYKIYYTIDGETKEFKGSYQLDLHKKLLDITASLKDPQEEVGGIVLSDKTLDFELIGKNADLYFISSTISQDPILLPYEDKTGLLVTKQYNLDVLVDGIHDAVNEALKSMNYTEEKNVTANIRDKEMTVNKKTLTMNYTAKKQFLSVFYETLINDYNFTSEYAKIKGRKSEEAEKVLKNLKTSAELKYSSDDGKTTYYNIYYKGKDVYRLEIDNRPSDDSYVIIDFDNNKLTVQGYKDGVINQKIVISRIDSYMNDILTRTYMFEFNINNEPITINLELTKENNPTVKVKDVGEAKSIREFTTEQIDGLKKKISVYTQNIDWIDKLKEIFGSSCSKDLSCVCNTDDTCLCNIGTSIITCPKSVIEAPEPANNIVE